MCNENSAYVMPCVTTTTINQVPGIVAIITKVVMFPLVVDLLPRDDIHHLIVLLVIIPDVLLVVAPCTTPLDIPLLLLVEDLAALHLYLLLMVVLLPLLLVAIPIIFALTHAHVVNSTSLPTHHDHLPLPLPHVNRITTTMNTIMNFNTTFSMIKPMTTTSAKSIRSLRKTITSRLIPPMTVIITTLLGIIIKPIITSTWKLTFTTTDTCLIAP